MYRHRANKQKCELWENVFNKHTRNAESFNEAEKFACVFITERAKARNSLGTTLCCRFH